MSGILKYKRIILVVVVIGITLVALYFGGGMLLQLMSQVHVPPPH